MRSDAILKQMAAPKPTAPYYKINRFFLFLTFKTLICNLGCFPFNKLPSHKLFEYLL